MFVDAHTHLDHFEPDELKHALEEIRQLPCQTWAVSMDIDSWDKNLGIAKEEPNIMPTFGIHPWNAHQFAHRLDELDNPTAASPHIGEIGLDFHWVEEKERWPLQETVFDYFLQKGAAQEKIVNLHTKGAESLILEKLQQKRIERAIIHWYSGDINTFDALVKRGYLFTFGVELPYNELIQACAKRCPAKQLLTETDGPGALEWLTGERSHPAHVRGVVAFLSKLRGEDPLNLQAQIWQNYCNLMR